VLALAGSIMGMVSLAGKESRDEPTAAGCLINFLCLAVVLGLCLLGRGHKAPGRSPTPDNRPPTFAPWPGHEPWER
jgi:hypothetical protein